MTDYFRLLDALMEFSGERAVKVDVFRGERLFVGLNCFEPGQSQKTHSHAGSDKVYVVLSGKARMLVGDQTREVAAGSVVWVPADVPHGVVEALERTVLLIAMAPPPGH
jgi:quercetin dioxygenase-like cupin family protein